MNYVRISGSREQLLSVHIVPGLMLQARSANEAEGGQWVVFGYAPDNAITALQGLGYTVDILIDQNAINDHLASLEDDSDGTAIV